MSIAPCQVCGGAGFVDAPLEASPQPERTVDVREGDENRQSSPTEKVPCPMCGGSGNNTGV